MVLLAKDEGGHQFEGEICAGKVLVIFCFFFVAIWFMSIGS